MLSILTVLQKLTNDNLRIDFQTGKVTLTGKIDGTIAIRN